MSAPILLPPLDPATQALLRKLYEEAPNGESRTRYQMLLPLARSPAEVLRHIGSQFAPDKEKVASFPPTHAA